MAAHQHKHITETRLEDFLRLISYLPRALKLIWQAAAGYTMVWGLFLLIQGVLPGIQVYLTKLVLDGAAEAIGGGLTWENMSTLIIPAALMAGIMALQLVSQTLTEWIQTAQSEYVEDYIQNLIHRQAARVDLEFYESSEYHDTLHQASSQATGKSLELLNNIGSTLQNGVTLVTIAAILIPYGLWIPLVLIVSTLPALWVVVQHNRRYHAWWKRATMDKRKTSYYNLMLTYDFPAPEVRAFDLGDHFSTAYEDLREELRNDRIDLIKKQSIARFMAGIIGLIAMGGVMALMVWRAFQGAATIGDLGLFYQAFHQGQSLMRTLLSNIGKIYTSSLFLEHLFAFLEIEPRIKDPETPRRPVPAPREEIRFRDITFVYPGSKQPALEGFNLSIPAGRVVAIVGQNGAGKSTLAKLLCRLYDPQEGSVEIDGVDIREYAVQEYRDKITVMFQFPMRYQETVEKNIAFGNVRNGRSRDRVVQAARKGLIHDTIEELPDGYQTQLGKWFEHGVELSGGQWQRIALARAFYREAPIVILDEPTSAMDSWAENQWLKGFGTLVDEGRTALVITHRFTTAMHADIIHVMHEGEVIESGTHEELLAREGHYASSWRAQVEHGWRASDGRPGKASMPLPEMPGEEGGLPDAPLT